MGLITIVRHGQARIDGEDYDQLSDLGRTQARMLGDWFARHGRRFQRVMTGPLRRHHQTLGELSAAMAKAESPLPEAEEHPGLTEHQAIAMIRHVLGEGARNHLDAADSPEDRRRRMREWFDRFDRTMRAWIRRDIDIEHLENWQQARQRTASALGELIEAAREGDVLVISSGGFLSMAVGHLWGLDDETVYELSLEVSNTGWAELRSTPSATRVRCFNAHPHIVESEILTLV